MEKKNLASLMQKANKGIFLGYATNSYAHRMYNKSLMIFE